MNPTTTTPAPPSVYITTAQKGLPHPAKSRSYLIQVHSELITGLFTQHTANTTSALPILSLHGAKDMNVKHSLTNLPATGERPLSRQQGFTLVFTLLNHKEKSKFGNSILLHEYMSLSVGGGGKDGRSTVSYTHLTLPTIYSV